MDSSAITYATSKDWVDIMKNRSKVRMHELIERLGLRAKWSSNKRGKTNFESALVRELVQDMADIVNTLPKESDDLMKCLSEEHSLRFEVDALLDKHGSRIWGRVGDREHLITANEPGVEESLYPRDLYVDSEEDKSLIHKLLHWWIGLKACNVILARERLDRERKKKEDSRKARAEAEVNGQNATGESSTPASFVALAPNSVFQSETGSRGSPISTTAMLTPPEAGGSPVAGPREGPGSVPVNGGATGESGISRSSTPNEQQPAKVVNGVWERLAARESGSSHQANAYWAAANATPPQLADSKIAVQQQIAQANQAVVDKQISVEVAKLVASFRSDDAATEDVPQRNASVPYPGLDYDTLRALRALIYNEECSVQWDEEALLNRLERTWRESVRADSDKMIQNIPVFIARERAILTWIELRRHLAALDRADRRWNSEGQSAPEIERRIQQHRTLMGATQTIIANFDDVGQGFGLGHGLVVDRDELLRQAFVVLAGEKYAVEMRWNPIEFTRVISWLGESLEPFRRTEEEEGRGTLWYVA
ncbi:uncharacterized protein M421DRAFT_416534 [Didymella exigua CBS 183.55]|uniref:Uncharacterized protein n=1 Tax=Didymella exigua CBS 183.55 TaxID=1150837 RepID=A0A6A5S609_9PLEO|nr:uncharacterized protein M421DRAFT_416534 [Didymella exigua CBS 183.55]KAF1932937.1 hypothetical protein M421DRAFT_416534 [Didymella exigua CBS 183.55]